MLYDFGGILFMILSGIAMFCYWLMLGGVGLV